MTMQYSYIFFMEDCLPLSPVTSNRLIFFFEIFMVAIKIEET